MAAFVAFAIALTAAQRWGGGSRDGGGARAVADGVEGGLLGLLVLLLPSVGDA